MKKPTIKDVADRASVSTSLVSRVMNAPLKEDGTPDCQVHPDTAKRIFNAISELGYHPNKAAVSLRKNLKKRIGVIIPNISNPFFADIARNIESIARKEGYIVLFGSTDENASQLETLNEAFLQDGVDGIIITPGVECSRQIEKIASQGMPVVLIIRDIPDLKGVGRVLTDDYAGTSLAINHLTEQGYRSIDMVSPMLRISNALYRENLFSKQMKAIGLPYQIHHENAATGLADIKLILEECIRRKVGALYCASASIPVRVIQAAEEMGLRIPEDIALIGYDGGEMFQILTPSITQIEYSREAIAKEAFTSLMKAIASQGMPPEISYIPPSLIVGSSTSKTTKTVNEIEDNSKRTLISALGKASIAIEEVMRLLK